MDKDTALLRLRSWLMGWALSLGCCVCLASCFQLDMPGGFPWICCLLALGSTASMVFPKSGRVLLPLGALAAGYFSRKSQVRAQFLRVFGQILRVFHGAYGWNVPELPPGSGEGVLPLAVLGLMICLAVSYGVCRRKSFRWSLFLGGGSLVLCAMAPDPSPPEWALFLLLESMGVLLFTAQVREQHIRQENRLGFAAALALGIFLGGVLLLVPKESYVNQSENLRQHLSAAAGQMPGEMGSRLALVLQSTSQAPQRISLSGLGPRQPGEEPVLTVTAQSSGPLYLRQRDYDSYDGWVWTSSPRRTDTLVPVGHGMPVTLRTETAEPLLLLPQPCADALTLTGGAVENSACLTEYTLLWGESKSETPSEVYSQLPEESRRVLEGRFSEDLSPGDIEKLLLGGHYTLSPEVFPQDGGDFAAWFLENGMEGYCIHFAATAAVLLRWSGLPARLVTGYLVQTQAGVPVTVTESDAHAWAEYYDSESHSWKIFEATPSQEEAMLTVGVMAEDGPEELPEQIREGSIAYLLWGMLGVLCAAIAAAMLLRHRQLRLAGPNAQALLRWQQALHMARLLGETPPPELHTLAQKARFSPHLLTETELGEFDSYIRFCRIQLGKNSFLKRLVLHAFLGVY